MICIIQQSDCNPEISSIEHVFPESIGGDRFTLNGSVCKNCNSYLGREIDSHLANHSFIIILRQQNGLNGKSGKIPSLFYKPFIDDNGNKWILTDEGFSMITPNIENMDGNTVKVTTDIKNIQKCIKDLNKKAVRSGYSPLPDSLEEQMRKLASDVSISKVNASNEFNIDLIEYQRSLLKIAYELGFYWLGKNYLNDPIAKEIRSSLCHPKHSLDSAEHWSKKFLIEGNIEFSDVKNIPKYLSPWVNRKKSHIAYSIKVRDRIFCIIRVFENFYAQIVLSENSKKYTNFLFAQFLEINYETRNVLESLLEEEFIRMAS